MDTTEEILTEKECSACGKMKSIKHYYRNKMLKNGYEPRCKICKNQGIKSKNRKPYGKKKAKVSTFDNFLRIAGVQKKDYYNMYRFFQSMNYNIDESIHEQFCKKHGLQPKKRSDGKENTWSLEEIREHFSL